MQSIRSAKKIFINIIAFVLVFTCLGAFLFVEQKGFVASNNNSGSDLIDEDAWHIIRNESAGEIASNAARCLIVFDELDPESVAVKENIEYTLETLNVNVCLFPVYIQEELNENEDSEFDDILARDTKTLSASEEASTQEISFDSNLFNYDDLVICTPSFSSFGLDALQLTEWCEKGGHVLFAAGVSEGVDFSVWGEILGIDPNENPSLLIADSLQFNTSLLAGVTGKEFSDDVITCEVFDFTILDKCTLHISTSDEYGTPLLWENPIGNGMSIICNADIMDSKNDRGIIAATYCRFYPVYVYPVINASVYCIDDFPSPAPAGYDKNIVSQYGYTVSNYYANVWMPAMQALSEKYGIKFSAFVIQTYEDTINEPFDNMDNKLSASHYASLILNMGGEVGIHGYNHQPLVLEGYIFDDENAGYTPWPSVRAMISSLKSAVEYTESFVDDLWVEAYVAPSNVISNEALQEMLSQLEDIRVYAGIYMGTSDQLVQEYEVLENGCVFCPRLTADMQMEDSEWWTQINELNFHYVASNFIHPDDILDEERSDGGDFNQMLEGYVNMIEWNNRQQLRNTTISECGAAVQRYGNLNYRQEVTGDQLKISVNGLIDTAYMMLRTNGKRPVDVNGGKITMLSDDVYILEIENETVTVKLVDTE